MQIGSSVVVAFQPLAGEGVLVAGDAWGAPPVPWNSMPSSDFFIARYGEDGRPDPSFGEAGTAISDFGGLDLARAMLVEPDGSILLGGASTDTSQSYCLRFRGFCDEEPVLAKFGVYPLDEGWRRLCPPPKKVRRCLG